MLDFSRLKSQRRCLALAIKTQNVAAVSRLLEAEEFINLNYMMDDDDDQGNTPLHIAACTGNLPITRILVQYGAAHNIHNRQGFFPIHLASFYAHFEVMVFLLDGKNFENQACILVEDRKKKEAVMRKTKKKVEKMMLGKEDERRLLVESEDEEWLVSGGFGGKLLFPVLVFLFI